MKADFTAINQLKRRYMEANKELADALSSLPVAAEASAAAERDYRVAKAKEVTRLKIEGYAVTLIADLCNGKVAEDRFKWKVAEGKFLAARENIKRLHKNIDTCQSLLSTEKAMMGLK